MKYLNAQNTDFYQQLKALQAFETAQDPKVDEIVATICTEVRQRGDAAVIEYSNRFDHTQAQTMADLTLSQDDLQQAFLRLPETVRSALTTAAKRI